MTMETLLSCIAEGFECVNQIPVCRDIRWQENSENNLKNPGAAAHFLDELETIYDRLINNPYQFPDSSDEYLFLRGYREALFEALSGGAAMSSKGMSLKGRMQMADRNEKQPVQNRTG